MPRCRCAAVVVVGVGISAARLTLHDAVSARERGLTLIVTNDVRWFGRWIFAPPVLKANGTTRHAFSTRFNVDSCPLSARPACHFISFFEAGSREGGSATFSSGKSFLPAIPEFIIARIHYS
jgi:hypothetical protein